MLVFNSNTIGILYFLNIFMILSCYNSNIQQIYWEDALLWWCAPDAKKDRRLYLLLLFRAKKKRTKGLCLVCAKEMGIPQVSEYMEQMWHYRWRYWRLFKSDNGIWMMEIILKWAVQEHFLIYSEHSDKFGFRPSWFHSKIRCCR